MEYRLKHITAKSIRKARKDFIAIPILISRLNALSINDKPEYPVDIPLQKLLISDLPKSSEKITDEDIDQKNDMDVISVMIRREAYFNELMRKLSSIHDKSR